MDPVLNLFRRVHALRLSRTSAFLDRTKHLRSRFEVWFSVQSLNLLIDPSAFFWRQLRRNGLPDRFEFMMGINCVPISSLAWPLNLRRNSLETPELASG